MKYEGVLEAYNDQGNVVDDHRFDLPHRNSKICAQKNTRSRCWVYLNAQVLSKWNHRVVNHMGGL